MRGWKHFITIIIACCLLSACSTQAIDGIEEISHIYNECEISSQETYMVNVEHWYGNFSHPHWCWRVHRSLAWWRVAQGGEWNFLTNPAQDGLLPAAEFRVVGLVYSNDVVSRVFALDVNESKLVYTDNATDFFWLDSGNNVQSTDVNVDQLEAVNGLVVEAVSGLASHSGWYTGPAPSEGPGWEALDGGGWVVVVCTENYDLYQFRGVNAAPPGVIALADLLWSLT